MPFAVNDYNDLITLIRENPQWQSQLRQVLLSDDFLALPEIVRAIAASQKRTDQRFEELAAAQQRTEIRFEELAAAQQRTEIRLEELIVQVQNLTVNQQRLEQRIEELIVQVQNLTVNQQRLEQRLDTVEQRLDKLDISHRKLIDTVGNMKGKMLELIYSERAGSYLGRILRKAKVVPINKLEDILDIHLTNEEFEDVFLLDLLVKGIPRHHPNLSEIYLALEISSVIDENDVIRALRRGNLLRKCSYTTIPVVAGEEITPDAKLAAQKDSIVILENGSISFWEEALIHWIQ